MQLYLTSTYISGIVWQEQVDRARQQLSHKACKSVKSSFKELLSGFLGKKLFEWKSLKSCSVQA